MHIDRTSEAFWASEKKPSDRVPPWNAAMKKKDPLWISGSAKVTPSSTISCVDPSCDLGTGQNPGTPGEPQNSWDLWMFIPLKMYL